MNDTTTTTAEQNAETAEQKAERIAAQKAAAQKALASARTLALGMRTGKDYKLAAAVRKLVQCLTDHNVKGAKTASDFESASARYVSRVDPRHLCQDAVDSIRPILDALQSAVSVGDTVSIKVGPRRSTTTTGVALQYLRSTASDALIEKEFIGSAERGDFDRAADDAAGDDVTYGPNE